MTPEVVVPAAFGAAAAGLFGGLAGLLIHPIAAVIVAALVVGAGVVVGVKALRAGDALPPSATPVQGYADPGNPFGSAPVKDPNL